MQRPSKLEEDRLRRSFHPRRLHYLLTLLLICWATALVAQSVEAPGVFRYTVKVPESVKMNGSSPISVTIKIYIDEASSLPIWSEQFQSSPDATGRFSVLIGSTVDGGLPRDLFAVNQARWIALQVGDAPEGARAAIISVPYALKARDSDTLGGLPASAFLHSASVQSDTGITGTGTSGTLAQRSGTLSESNVWSALQSMNGGLLTSSFNEMQVVGQGSNTTVQAAIDALPASGGTVMIPAGSFSCGISIKKPVRLMGAAGGGFNDNTNYSTYTGGTVLRNTAKNNDCITVSLPTTGSLGGVVIENLWIQGNKAVGGASAGDNIVIAGGNAANKNLRHVTLRNVLSTDSKGNGLTIKDNAYMLSVYDSQFYRAAANGIAILGFGAGMPSQIALYSVTSDANAGDAMNLNGVAVHDVHAFRSTFADSTNGVNVMAGSTNAAFTCTGCNFESNANAGVLIKDGYAHNIENSSFPSDGIQKYGVYLDPPSRANYVNQQLSLSNNSFGANTTKDVYISANVHFATIWPNSPSNYTYQDLSGVAQQILGKMAETDFTGTLKVASALSVGGGGMLTSTNQSGTGSICMTTNCVMTTPNLGAATAMRLTIRDSLSAANIAALGAVSAANVTATGAMSSATSLTATNCVSAGAICESASAGRVTIAASAKAITVITSAVTANSEIFVQEDQSLGSALGVTCNTTMGRSYAVTARTPETSFVITASAAPFTNPACLSYRIVN